MASFALNGPAFELGGVSCVDLRLYIEKLRKSQDKLIGVIVSSYRLTLEAVELLFPSFKDSSNEVHFLLLHGEKNESRLIQFDSFAHERRHKVSIWDVFPQYLGFEHTSHATFATMGVHHPKYVLLFTRTTLHVIITSANFNGSDCTDASCIQSFPLSTSEGAIADENKSDFGKVLSDFLNMVQYPLHTLHYSIVTLIILFQIAIKTTS